MGSSWCGDRSDSQKVEDGKISLKYLQIKKGSHGYLNCTQDEQCDQALRKKLPKFFKNYQIFQKLPENSHNSFYIRSNVF